MVGSVRVKGRWFGVTFHKPAPTAAMALAVVVSRLRSEMQLAKGLHYDYPVEDIRGYQAPRYSDHT